MPSYERCDQSVEALAREILTAYESHKPLVAVAVKIDYVFARADVDEDGNQVGDAITKDGHRVIGEDSRHHHQQAARSTHDRRPREVVRRAEATGHATAADA
jgi:hypothetical protein